MRGRARFGVLAIALIAMAHAQGVEWRELTLEGVELRYALALPDGFEPAATYPVLLALPPGPQTEEMVAFGFDAYWGSPELRRDWVVVSPVAPGGQLFFRGAERHIPALLDAVAEMVRVEGGRVHLAGVSNGGLSAFRIALDLPERAASVTALPGFLPSRDEVASLDALARLPVTIFVGERDQTWLDAARDSATRIEEAGGVVSLTVVPGEGHVIQGLAYRRSDTLARVLDAARLR